VSDAAFNDRSEAFAFIEEIDRVSEPDAIVRRMQRVAGNFGLHSVVVARLPNGNEQRPEDFVLVDKMPAEFARLYVERGCVHVDPVLRRLRRSAMPFEYRTEPDPESEPRAREVMRFRRDFGIRMGFVVPVRARIGTGLVSVSGERPELPSDTKPALHLMALYAFERISDLLRPRASERRQLTEREREVLRWVAVGKSAWEIGEILCIARRTVDEHTQTAARKLGAVNRTQAVAIALRDHVIAI
jgi:LuxR family quorum sensing-dependent transcriptional regulator